MSSPSKNKSKKPQSENEENACPVCFKHVDIYSIGACDHAICYECSTRMRVLCKQMECPICRQELVKVAFVKSVTPFHHLAFNSYLMDKAAKIYFENPNIQDAFSKLLVHSCAVCSVQPSFPNLQALKDHLRKEHEMFFCDLCVDHLKIFTWERKAYTRSELALHRRKGDPDNTSHRGHPLCNFCDQRYVDGDELFRHLRRDHYFCHYCDADGLNQYYCAYEDLREHFREAHFLCEEGECKEEKFTRVFRTDIDFRAHRAQAHSQSLGKAAAKQARTLELEFTLAPRAANEPKGRNQQRRGGRNREREETDAQPVPESSAPRFVGPAATVAADIRDPQQFPSLSAEQGGSSAAQGRPNAPDSLAQKIAKGNRFTVRSNNGVNEDEFPSLVSESSNEGGRSKQPEAGRAASKGTGAKHSVHVRVGRADQNDTNGGARLNNNSPNVSIHLTQKYPPAVAQGAGPPPPQQKQQPPVARVTRVSSSQNIHVQPSLGLPMDSDFPTLGPPTAGPSSSAGTGWAKKEQAKPSKNVVKTAAPKNPRQPSADDYPALAPSSSKSPLETPGWNAAKAKPAVVNGGKVVAVNGTSKSAAPVQQQPAVESWGDPSKGRGKGKKKNAAKPNMEEDEVTVFANEAERKVSEMQIGELKHLSTYIGGKKLDLTSVANAAEPKSMSSKIGLIKQPVDSKPAESGGVKPKTKLKPASLKSEADFPSLGPTVSSVPTFFEKKKKNYPSSPPPPPPPGFALGNVTPTKVTFTSSSGQSFPLPTESSAPVRTFTQPPDFALRNQQLISTVADLLCNQQTKINEFRTVSSQFRNDKLEPNNYYHSCLDIMGEDCFTALFPELVCLLPDIEKQQQLLKVHRSEIRMKGGALSAEPYVICATCSQVLSPSDLKHHIASHSLETNFPVLGPSSSDANSAWSKR